MNVSHDAQNTFIFFISKPPAGKGIVAKMNSLLQMIESKLL